MEGSPPLSGGSPRPGGLAWKPPLPGGQKLWQCNDKIAELNFQRFSRMDLTRNLTPALLSYEGIQYQYMAPQVFTEQEWAYAQEHLRILSGFYGVLRPLDGVVPYRLEMQAKTGRAQVPGCTLPGMPPASLYDFWGGNFSMRFRMRAGSS